MKLDLVDIYTEYSINQNHSATSTGLANMFQGEISHDQMSRDVVLILDDTISEKPYTDKNVINWRLFSC